MLSQKSENFLLKRKARKTPRIDLGYRSFENGIIHLPDILIRFSEEPCTIKCIVDQFENTLTIMSGKIVYDAKFHMIIPSIVRISSLKSHKSHFLPGFRPYRIRPCRTASGTNPGIRTDE